MAVPDTIYGTDLVWRDGTITGTNRDYQEINGLDNLKQSIYNRLITRKGSWRTRPEYGCSVPDKLKKPMTTNNLTQLKNDIVSNLLLDKRLSAVNVSIQTTQFSQENGSSIPGIIVTIQCVASGQPLTFAPFTFVQEN